MTLESISNFKVGFVVAIALVTFLISAAVIAIPNIAYSQSINSVPNNDSINNANNNNNNNKVVILNFDDAYESQYTNAKPILDKYGYKATFYIVCNYIGNNGRLRWEDIAALYNDGNDIASHTMNHADLSKTSKKETQYEVGESKQCLLDHGINTTSFAYPFNGGSDEAAVVDIVAKYYDIARTARSAPEPIMYLHCDGFKEESTQTDCRTYSDDGTLNFVNRYSIIGWSHDADRLKNSYDDLGMFNRFIEVVNSPSAHNTDDTTINAIPIIIWHRIDNSGEGDPEVYATTIDLFEKEINYLHDNGFKVLTMADIGYDENSNYLYLKR
jgi:peptidoglycan/xylan/chitin deacetylase (PgdA/CDA1 family)